MYLFYSSQVYELLSPFQKQDIFIELNYTQKRKECKMGWFIYIVEYDWVPCECVLVYNDRFCQNKIVFTTICAPQGGTQALLLITHCFMGVLRGGGGCEAVLCILWFHFCQKYDTEVVHQKFRIPCTCCFTFSAHEVLLNCYWSGNTSVSLLHWY